MAMQFADLVAALSIPDADSRRSAAEALAQGGQEAQVAAVALTKAVGDDDEEVRQWATAALESLGPPAAGDVAELAGLVADANADVAYWAVTLLGRLNSGMARLMSAARGLDTCPAERHRETDRLRSSNSFKAESTATLCSARRPTRPRRYPESLPRPN